jgi:branched-subunit amino acid aminotransferase/4-amino-4-deoxychorismate lyase
MGIQGPRSEVFTTVRVDANGKVADWPAHMSRLQAHAKRLRFPLPDLPYLTIKGEGGQGLARIAYRPEDGAWKVTQRPLGVHDEAVDAVTHPAPRWNERTNGCKHGHWDAYQEAKSIAEQNGCDVALLVHDHAIVDADRATPLLLDEDGTVWMAPLSDGGVEGIAAAVLEAALPTLGFPVVRGRLNERTVARCAELVVVGTGMGVCRIDSIDGEPVGDSTALSTTCQTVLREHFTNEATWSTTGQERGA